MWRKEEHGIVVGHVRDRTGRMPKVVLQQVSSSYAKKNRGKTLDKPVALKYVEKHLARIIHV